MPDAKHIVCLIDDDNIYQYTARVILESTGLAKSIQSFYNGSDALTYLKEPGNFVSETLPDVIFLDINMPIMDGWEFLEEYNKFSGNLPKPIAIYMVSSSVNSSDMQKSRSYKAVSDYLVKPVSRSKYQELMESL
ncbi:MAG: response regulator [Bacteroidota bacterium]